MSDLHLNVDESRFRLELVGRTTIHLLKEAVDDIADEIEEEAKRLAPVDTGALREHPVERDDSRIGVADRGGLFRAEGGAFFGGRGLVGDVVARIQMSLPEEPEHAVWVHEGTGIYGPRRSPIVPTTKEYLVFDIDGRTFSKKSVRGQEAQPYLRDAILLVERTYVPARIQILRGQIRLAN